MAGNAAGTSSQPLGTWDKCNEPVQNLPTCPNRDKSGAAPQAPRRNHRWWSRYEPVRASHPPIDSSNGLSTAQARRSPVRLARNEPNDFVPQPFHVFIKISKLNNEVSQIRLPLTTARRFISASPWSRRNHISQSPQIEHPLKRASLLFYDDQMP